MLIGRSATADVRLDDARVSGEHALLRWTGAAWEVRDLGSKNGTFIAERRLASGARVHLLAGDVFSLGGPRLAAPSFHLVDTTAPIASARHITSGVVQTASSGLINLPNDEQPLASMIEEADGNWTVEADGVARMAMDRETIVVNGEAWILDLPLRTSSTAEAVESSSESTLASISLRFAVTPDEERVDITVVRPDREIELPPRSHHYLLLTLARARLATANAPPNECGWLERKDVCRMLAVDELRINVDVCRARKQFSLLGIQDAANIVDRRMGTGRIRLGVERVHVRKLA